MTGKTMFHMHSGCSACNTSGYFRHAVQHLYAEVILMVNKQMCIFSNSLAGTRTGGACVTNQLTMYVRTLEIRTEDFRMHWKSEQKTSRIQCT
mmetsp:Transcript_19295/g.37378  ORF Transcript_19295/g.37378 Transcript_19295/m.37378 type:complete len:93 (-) Transcript_19295:1017-1295(-)